jgi:hypothetical protein
MSDLEQQRRSVRALELLGESADAYDSGDMDACDTLAARARSECGEDTVTFILGGITIGEIPAPGSAAWVAFLFAQQSALAQIEALTGEDGCE